MSLFGSLYSSVSGLNAQSRALGMISDNVANVSTTGYKASAARFANLVTRQANTVNNYRPGGVRALTYQTVSNQGLIQSTASATDAAISGAGFFVVNSGADGNGEQLYTRAGDFTPDSFGNLQTASGFYLQGWALNADDQVADINTLQNVNVNLVNGVAKATTRVEVGANLNADQAPYTGAYAAGDMALNNASDGAAGAAPSFKRDVQVYDSLGRSHALTLAFLRSGDPNEWQVELYGQPGELDAGDHPNGLLASGTVSFAGNGSLASADLEPTSPGAGADEIGITWSDDQGAAPSSLAFDLGAVGATTGLTQFSSPTSVAFVNQNGAEVGELNGVRLDQDGYVIASFTNGEEDKLYRLPLATFANPSGLDMRSGNVFAQNEVSGTFNLRIAGEGGAGTLTPSALEAANVDLADEFTRMIVTQRAYSANARIITTTDEMLSELISIKR